MVVFPPYRPDPQLVGCAMQLGFNPKAVEGEKAIKIGLFVLCQPEFTGFRRCEPLHPCESKNTSCFLTTTYVENTEGCSNYGIFRAFTSYDAAQTLTGEGKLCPAWERLG